MQPPSDLTRANDRAGPRRGKRGQRTGWSTGACAAAAATAAARGLVTGVVPSQIEILLPQGRRPVFSVAAATLNAGVAQAVVVKDAGDDPDVTHGARIAAQVRTAPHAAGMIRLLGGPGIGRVTRPGLGLRVGEAAINPGPHAYITANLRAAAAELLIRAGLDVTLSIADGERLAQRTLNARLGIVGGLSILGTTGVVYPYSTASFKATVRQGVQVALAQGERTLCFSTGRRTERYCMETFPALPEVCFVQMGDFVGTALDAVREAGITQVLVGGMSGKLAKMAQGLRVTHARKAPVDMAHLAELAARCGATPELCRRIAEGATARWVAELTTEAGLSACFHRALVEAAARALAAGLAAGTRLEVIAFAPDGQLLARTERLCD
ncbi:cobalt-precorrin-5B (C(1))-methyltransferase [Thiocapsa imhoffii]|uniref:Cobalt-precorrin-5B C(1)-methyltransferase n=1 Tax=Thiocapsa imhoffii TaxID=382777 RepID=A0A9X0WIY7_9GAMM|nr:cobalt-precorrin-5B (C(1))-methyltransferase [Thiocapsa imhoffii]MBK1645597.1 cobalt-precorrin-5B (C(1))-methyltransferase [Thiocapsa imhoffii]